jgi:ubiquinone/menaquinone biosynthesis C-methylase UbiE
MAFTSPKGFDVDSLRKQIQATYDRVAHEPKGEFHFHRGGEYAVSYLGYDPNELAMLPIESTARFAGVGNPLRIGPVNQGETVLDHACGAGMDLLLAAHRVGPSGRAIGVDMTPAMVDCAVAAADLAGLGERVDVRLGFYENLPVDDESVDVVISNGVVNLSPDKEQVFREIYRVLKPGGRLYLADVVIQRELNDETRNNPALWAACVGGALLETELPELAHYVGLEDGKIVQRFNCFYNTSAEDKVSKDLFVHAVNFSAQKPG